MVSVELLQNCVFSRGLMIFASRSETGVTVDSNCPRTCNPARVPHPILPRTHEFPSGNHLPPTTPTDKEPPPLGRLFSASRRLSPLCLRGPASTGCAASLVRVGRKVFRKRNHRRICLFCLWTRPGRWRRAGLALPESSPGKIKSVPLYRLLHRRHRRSGSSFLDESVFGIAGLLLSLLVDVSSGSREFRLENVRSFPILSGHPL